MSVYTCVFVRHIDVHCVLFFYISFSVGYPFKYRRGRRRWTGLASLSMQPSSSAVDCRSTQQHKSLVWLQTSPETVLHSTYRCSPSNSCILLLRAPRARNFLSVAGPSVVGDRAKNGETDGRLSLATISSRSAQQWWWLSRVPFAALFYSSSK